MSIFEDAQNNANKAVNNGFAPVINTNINANLGAGNIPSREIPQSPLGAEATYNAEAATAVQGEEAQYTKAESADISGKGTAGARTEFTYPYGGIWGGETAGTFPGVQLEVRANKQKGASARSAFKEQDAAPVLAKYKLLLQDKDFGGNTSHTWEAYKGGAGPLNNLFATLYGQGKNVKDFISNISENASSLVKGDFSKAVGAANAESPYVRFDQSSVYANTANRKISFSFEFMTPPQQSKANIMGDICKGIEEYSCANTSDEYSFTPPGIGRISIIAPGGKEIGSLKYCALKDVKTSISGPGKGGYPAKMELMLDFEHLPPAFGDNGGWISGGGGMPSGSGGTVTASGGVPNKIGGH